MNPTPWTIREGGRHHASIRDADKAPVCVCRGQHAYEIAEFILHRVHCHEKLVEALDEEAHDCAVMGDCDKCQGAGIECKTYDALKLAKEKPS